MTILRFRKANAIRKFWKGYHISDMSEKDYAYPGGLERIMVIREVYK